MKALSVVRAYYKLFISISIVTITCVNCSLTNWPAKVNKFTYSQVERKLGLSSTSEELDNGFFTHEWMTSKSAVLRKVAELETTGLYNGQTASIDHYDSVWTKFTFNPDSILVEVSQRTQDLDKNSIPIP